MHNIPARTEPKADTAPPERVREARTFESERQREAARKALSASQSRTREEARARELESATRRLERLDIATARGVIASQPLHTRQVYLIAEMLGQNRERVLKGFNVSPTYLDRYAPAEHESAAGVNLLQAAGEVA